MATTKNDAPLAPGVSSDRSIQVTRKTHRSAFTSTAQHLIKPFNSLTVKIGKRQPAGSVKLHPPKKALKSVDVEEKKVDGIYLYEFRAKALQRDKSRRRLTRARLYYFCGGGWQNLPTVDHWRLCASIAAHLPDITLSLVSYPLAPSSPAPSAFPLLMRMYDTLLREAESAHEKVILAGDSSGGNIVLALVLAALAENKEARTPTSIMAISPSTDLRRQNPDILAVEKHDPVLRLAFVKHTATAWCGDWDASDPRLSPLFADVAPLATRGVHVYGVTGTYDILAPDAVLFREKCNEAGVKGEWLEWEKQMHCFPLAFTYKLPESMKGFEWILDVLARCP